MSTFISRILVDKRGILSFSFNRLFTANGMRYFVSVADKPHHQYYFLMEQENGAWIIMERSKLPDWLLELEPSLSKAIIKGAEGAGQ